MKGTRLLFITGYIIKAALRGAELFNDYFSRLPEHAQNIEIRAARYDEKHDVLTAYTTWNGYDDYRHEEHRKQYNEGRYNKYDHKKQGGI